MKIKMLLLLLIVGFSVVNAQSTKHALIFAIGNYPKEKGWDVITSGNDVPYIKTILINQKFEEKNIKVVKDAEATKAGITKAIEELIGRTKKGDVVVIHFSSHGEQVADNNRDETDGYDETIVSYDAILPRFSTDFKKDQANYFRDDEFGALINQLRARLGKEGDVVVFMDACHSGSGTRGIAKVRGGQPPFVPIGFDITKFQSIDTAGVFMEGKPANSVESELATYVVISAARAEELNNETRDDKGVGMGSLTYAMSKVFENLDSGSTYRVLFSKILGVMNSKVPKQNPVLEGTGIDRTLFGGRFVWQRPYVEISKMAGKKITIKSGLFAGLDVGAKVEVYQAGTIDPSKSKEKLITEGKVTQAGNFSAEITLRKDPQLKKTTDAWVFVTMPVFKIDPISLEIITSNARGASTSGFFTEADVTRVKKDLRELPLVTFTGVPELLLVKGEGMDSLKIATNGYVFQPVNGASSQDLQQAIQNYAQYKILQKEIKSQDFDFDVKLVPFVNGKADTNLLASKYHDGAFEFNETDTLALWIINKTKKPVYFNILDLQPNGVINSIVPNASLNIYPSDLKIKADTSIIGFDNFTMTITPPYGLEIFKVFVSFNEINMETIGTTRGASGKGNLNSFELFVQNSVNATRGVTGNVSNAEGATFNIPFRIVEKKQ